MNIPEAMLAAQGGGTTRQLGQQFGLDEGQVSSALSALVPALTAMMMGTMSKQAAGTGGVQASLSSGGSLLGMLAPMPDSNRDGSMVDDVIGMLGRFTRS